MLGAPTSIHIPLSAEILHAGIQNGKVFIWARVDPEKVLEQRWFRIYGTGQRIIDDDE